MLDPTSDPYVRVVDTDTGHEVSVRKSVATSLAATLKPVTKDGKPADAVDGNGDPLPPVYAGTTAPAASSEPKRRRSSSGPTVAQLREEINRRNAGRGEDDLIQVAPPGNKPELLAALEADTQANGRSPEES